LQDVRPGAWRSAHSVWIGQISSLVDAPDEALQITQEHLLAGARSVLHARAVMAQSIFDRAGSPDP
jgi:hypothetical protein